MMRARRRTAITPARIVVVLLAGAVALAACSSNSAPEAASSSAVPPPASSSPTPSPTATSSSAAPSTPAPVTTKAEQVLATLSEAQRVGQLLMVDCPTTSVAPATVTAIQQQYVGGVILDGTSQLSLTGTAAITARLQQSAPSTAALLISTDQEGGEVQRLQGDGFSAVPSALQQGQLAPATLQADATLWGKQLAAAGVNVDLAPVMDTVPAGFGSNPPIGDLDREFGHDTATVASHGSAVVTGLTAADVAATIKHFPGLGRVRGNTDTTSGVTDSVTTPNDPYFQPFAAGIKAGAPLVMMSTAIYTQLDPGVPAAFSKAIVTGILRTQLGFRGVVISDDLGAAVQVSGYTPGQRAVDFVGAGGDIVLTVDPSVVSAMTSALLAKAQSDPAFKTLVDAAALRVLDLKQTLGLLH